jgi:hypothetical protein
MLHAANLTNTTLTLSSNSVTAGTVVTFTAAVSNGSPVVTGLVTFCDAAAAFCLNGAMLGTAQLTPSGTAVIKFRPGIGSHTYKAVFSGTTTDLPSTSTTQSLTVTALGSFFATTTEISSSGSAGDYTLTGTVVATGSRPLSPTGSVEFVDTTINYTLGSAALTASLKQFLASPAAYATGTMPFPVAVGDFNGDGILDLAVANWSGNTVSALLGNSDGTFQTQVSYATDTSPCSLAVGDFNGDGKLDLALANTDSNTVSVLLGNGDGTFQAQVAYATGSTPQWVAVADFNGDGKPDLAVANNLENTVSVLLGNGDGTFLAGVTYATGVSAYSVAVGDFNGDGLVDLVVANFGANSASVLLGNGDGTFQTQVTYATGTNPYSIAVGDFNGDGISDLAVVNFTSETLSVLLGNGNGTFQTQVTYATGSQPYFVAVGDFDGDGNPDLAVTNIISDTVNLLLGNGDGTFRSPVAYAAGSSPIGLAVGDFNGDGIPDLAVANIISDTVSVLLNTQSATATISGISIPGSGTEHLVKAVYPGDANFAASESSTISLTSTQITTSLILTASPPTSSDVGQEVTLTATLSPTPVGDLTTDGETITFMDGATTLGTGPLSSGVATLSTSSLAEGSHSLTAVYAGDTNFLASASPAVDYTVNPLGLPTRERHGRRSLITTRMILTASPASNSHIGQQLTLKATLRPAAVRNLTTGGETVTFMDGARTLGTGTLSSGVATLSTSSLAAGRYSLTAVYAGDTNFLASISQEVHYTAPMRARPGATKIPFTKR